MRAHALIGLTLIAFAPPAAAAPARKATPPRAIGACAMTTVTSVGTRLANAQDEPIPDSGVHVALANGVYGVSYEAVPAVSASRKGDRTLTCLVSIPKECPPGDARGRFYTTTNLRTLQSWTLPDSQHMCGGA